MNPRRPRQNFDPRYLRLLFDPRQNFMDPRFPRHLRQFFDPHQNFTDASHPRQSLTHATHEPTLSTPPTLFSRFNRKGVNIIQFCSISVNFLACIFLVQSLMLELPKIFLIVRFFSCISYNKGLKAKISCFFSCFFCLTPMRQKCSRIRKTTSFPTSPKLKKYKNLHPRSFTNEAKTW